MFDFCVLRFDSEQRLGLKFFPQNCRFSYLGSNWSFSLYSSMLSKVNLSFFRSSVKQLNYLFCFLSFIHTFIFDVSLLIQSLYFLSFFRSLSPSLSLYHCLYFCCFSSYFVTLISVFPDTIFQPHLIIKSSYLFEFLIFSIFPF